MNTNITKKQIKAVASKDPLKPVLNGVLYEPEKNRITACNGYAIISYKVEASQNDSSGVLPVDLFKSKISDQCTYEINGVAKRIDRTSEAVFNLIEDKYPDYEAVIPKDFANKHEVAINLELFKQLYDAVIKDDDNKKHIKLIFDLDNCNSAIKFEQFASCGGDPVYSGVVMPCRLNNERSK